MPRPKPAPTPRQMPAARQIALIPGPLDHISPTAGVLVLTTARATYWQYGQEIYRQPAGDASTQWESTLAAWNATIRDYRADLDAKLTMREKYPPVPVAPLNLDQGWRIR